MRRVAFSWLIHPVTVLGLGLLLLNDHYLKAAHPSWLTGKLSDAAGLVMAPALLAVLLTPFLKDKRVGPVATVTVGVGFALVKAWPYATTTASSAWSLLRATEFRTDLTDLITLPFLGVAYWAFRHSFSAASSPAASSSAAPSSSSAAVSSSSFAATGGRWWRAARVGVLLPVALVGVVATSAPESPSADAVESIGGALYAGANEQPYRAVDWSVSRDGGHTWMPSAVPPGYQEKVTQPRLSDCSKAQPQTCYRLVRGELAVQMTTDGRTWADDWRLSEEEREALYREYGDVYNRDGQLSGRSIVVRDLPSGGHVVVVANVRDGFAVRDAAGTWTRIGFPATSRAAAVPAPALNDITDSYRSADVLFAVGIGLLFAGLAATGAAVAANARAGGSPHWAWFLVPQLAAGPFVLLFAEWGRTDPSSVLFAFPVLSVAVTGFVALLCVLVVTPIAMNRMAGAGRWLLRTAAVFAVFAVVQTGVAVAWLRHGAEHGLTLALISLVVWSAALATAAVLDHRTAQPGPAFQRRNRPTTT
ncbi:hypothetical protein [Paractinoplanes atraurantiacus]|uniref:hypothetical protein n=1 Tax=Paractinoplanes atraurantiacus TaxID=1036182 RepID=UPI0015CF2868|nr:hypothetical protein [Actinoplanes atraurantiacus]